MDDVIDDLNAISAHYIGINSGDSESDMITLATATGTTDPSGLPYVFTISMSGTGLGAQLVDAIAELSRRDSVELTFRLRDDPADSVDTVTEFVDYVQPSITGGWPDPADPSVTCDGGLEVADLYDPLDGRPDSFESVHNGTPVCFDIFVKRNVSVAATPGPQVFPLEIDIVADGDTVLETFTVHFIVPPREIPPGVVECP